MKTNSNITSQKKWKCLAPHTIKTPKSNSNKSQNIEGTKLPTYTMTQPHGFPMPPREIQAEPSSIFHGSHFFHAISYIIFP